MTKSDIEKAAEEYANPHGWTQDKVSLIVWNSITRSKEKFLAGANYVLAKLEAAGVIEWLELCSQSHWTGDSDIAMRQAAKILAKWREGVRNDLDI